MSEFEGIIGRTLADSEPHFVEPPHPGEVPDGDVTLGAATATSEMARQ